MCKPFRARPSRYNVLASDATPSRNYKVCSSGPACGPLGILSFAVAQVLKLWVGANLAPLNSETLAARCVSCNRRFRTAVAPKTRMPRVFSWVRCEPSRRARVHSEGRRGACGALAKLPSARFDVWKVAGAQERASGHAWQGKAGNWAEFRNGKVANSVAQLGIYTSAACLPRPTPLAQTKHVEPSRWPLFSCGWWLVLFTFLFLPRASKRYTRFI